MSHLHNDKKQKRRQTAAADSPHHKQEGIASATPPPFHATAEPVSFKKEEIKIEETLQKKQNKSVSESTQSFADDGTPSAPTIPPNNNENILTTLQRKHNAYRPHVKQHKRYQLPTQQKNVQQFKQFKPFQLKDSKAYQKSQGQLPEEVQAKMENTMGHDFSNVNIHQDSQQATDAGALAYAQGNDVHFAPGQFKPNTSSGQELIGHELAHVAQQREGRVKPTKMLGKGMAVNDDPALEKEADDMGRKAASSQAVQRAVAGQRNNTSTVIQRSALSDELKDIWENQGKGPFFDRLRALTVCDPDINAYVANNFKGDDKWLAENILQYGIEANWPVHLRVEREMKGWGDSGGKGAVFDILRTANGAEAANAALTNSLAILFSAGTEDIWLAQLLQQHGIEANWPIHLRVEREMKGWADSGGKGVVFDILRTAAGAEANNSILSSTLRTLFLEGSQDLILAIRLQAYGPEANFPADLPNHATGAEIDTFLNASPFINQFVEDKVNNGLTVQGSVYIHPDPQFIALATVYLAGTTINPADVNAYRDGSEIHVNIGRGERGTTIHEAIHFYSDNAYKNELGFNANEGTTEFFTRIITTEQGIARGNFYLGQRGAIDALAAKVGQDVVANAYFHGNLSPLKSAVNIDDSWWTMTFGETTFDKWVNFMKAEDYAAANALL